MMKGKNKSKQNSNEKNTACVKVNITGHRSHALNIVHYNKNITHTKIFLLNVKYTHNYHHFNKYSSDILWEPS